MLWTEGYHRLYHRVPMFWHIPIWCIVKCSSIHIVCPHLGPIRYWSRGPKSKISTAPRYRRTAQGFELEKQPIVKVPRSVSSAWASPRRGLGTPGDPWGPLGGSEAWALLEEARRWHQPLRWWGEVATQQKSRRNVGSYHPVGISMDMEWYG